MPDNPLERSLKEAARLFEHASSARRSGQMAEARRQFLLAAEQLMLAAGLSKGPLRENRKRLAEKLLAEARSIQVPVETRAGSAAPPAGKKSEKPISAGEDAQAPKWMVRERPSVRFSDIAGLDEVKEQIRLKLLYPFTHTELADKYGVNPGGGLLLYGPPGTGKTMIARAVAGEIDAAFFSIKPSEIMSQWVGLSEQNIANLFDEAAQYPLSVIFIDEVESLAPKRRGSSSTVMTRVVPQLLAELDGFEKRANPMLFIGATNEPWAIDPAVLRPGRLDRLIYVPPPDLAARHKILELNLRTAPLSEDVMLDQLALKTEGFSGADMASIADQVRELVFSEAVRTGSDRSITTADFDTVLAQTTPSIRPEDLRLYEKFAAGDRRGNS